MFSAWTQLALRLLYEFWRERETGLRMTLPELKRRIGVPPATREAGQVVRALSGAALIGHEWRGGSPKFFFTEDTASATLYDLVAAADGRVTLGAGCAGYGFFRLPPEFDRAARAEEEVGRAVASMLRAVPVRELFPWDADEDGYIRNKRGR